MSESKTDDVVIKASRNDRPPAGKDKDVVYGVVAAVGGALTEWYDFAIYLSFAVVIGPIFFPHTDGALGLLATLAVFAAGYVSRFAGALLWGPLGDRFGRKAVLPIAIATMGIATFGIAVLPGYDTIGIVAPILLVLFRLVQGLSVGGEWGGIATYLAEIAPPKRRGLITSLNQATADGGFLVGAGVAALLYWQLSSAEIAEWGWRLAFGIGGVIAIFALIVRLKIKETDPFLAMEASRERKNESLFAPLRKLIVNEWRVLLRMTILLIPFVFTAYVYLSFPAVLGEFRDFDPLAVELTVVAALASDIVFIFIGGALSDRFGRLPVMRFAIIWLLVAAFPAFLIVMNATDVSGLILGAVMLTVFTGLYGGCLAATFTEAMPTEVRFTGSSIGYQLPNSLIGGITPIISASLIAMTGNFLVTAGVAVATGLIALTVLLRKNLGHKTYTDELAVRGAGEAD